MKLPFLVLMLALILLLLPGCMTTASSTLAGPSLSQVTRDTCSCPALVFSDPEFAFELRRTLSAAYAGEADIGECLATASRIREGDFESW